MRSVSTRLLTAITLALALLVPTVSAQAASIDVQRVSGPTRFETAVEVSQAAWPDGAPVAYVATGRDFADALAIAAAGAFLGPVLLTQPDALPSVTATELRRLDPSNIVVVGGTAAVSEAVRLAIARNATGTSVAIDRLSGPDRYETAIAIGQALNPEPDVVYLTDGHDSSASLVAAAAAGVQDGILLTTNARTLPRSVETELARIAPLELVIVGTLGADVVSAASRWATSTRRIDAATDTALSVAVSRDVWATTQDVLLASAADFPDALAAASWAVQAEVTLLLTNPKLLEDVTACELFRLEATGVVITGGTAAVSQVVADEILAGISPFARGCEGSALVEIPDPDPRTEAPEVTLFEMTTSPDSKRAYIINNEWNSVEVIDLVEGLWLGRIAVGSNPVDLDISPDGKRLYVANNGSQSISVIDTTKPFDQAEVNQINMLRSGTNARRPFAVETSTDGFTFIIPARLESADTAACIQVMRPDGTLFELEPGSNVNIPTGAVGAFHSTDHKLVGIIASDRGVEPSDTTCEDSLSPSPTPTPTPTASPTAEPTEDPDAATEAQGLALYTYVNSTWERVGSWGRNVAEVAYGEVGANGVTTDGGGTTTVFEAVDRSSVLGTISSEAGSSFGLAVEPLQPSCAKTRGNPARCTQVAYNVVAGADGLGAVDILDMTVGKNVAGSFRVLDTFPLKTPLGTYGGKNAPSDPGLQNQVAVTADAKRLIVATEFAVEIFPIG